LAFTEIRQYGGDSIQIMRRLRAMLENLIDTLPAIRAPLLRQELRLLESSAKRMFPDMDDQTLAQTGDLQGMGGGDSESHLLDHNQPVTVNTDNSYPPLQPT